MVAGWGLRPWERPGVPKTEGLLQYLAQVANDFTNRQSFYNKVQAEEGKDESTHLDFQIPARHLPDAISQSWGIGI